MRTFSRWTILSCGAAAAVALTGCANISGNTSSAPKPAKSLPAPIVSLLTTDVGEYFGTPRPGTSAKDIQATIDKLKSMPGVQSVDLGKDGRIDLQFHGGSTHPQHADAVRQLAAIATIEEGV